MWFVTLVMRNVLRRKVRSLLTALGAAIAVGSMVALVGISDGFERSFQQLYTERGVDLLVVKAGRTTRLTSTMPESLGERLAALPGVERVSPGVIDVVSLDSDFIGIPINGWRHDSFLFDKLTFLSGRNFHEGEHRVVAMGSVLASRIGKTTGDMLEIETVPFEVCGVFESFNVYENGSLIVPLDDLQELMDRKGTVTGYAVVLARGGDHPEAIARLRSAVRQWTDESGRLLGLDALPTNDFVQTAQEIRTVKAMAWTTSAIALFIGTVGMLNTMLMMVFERTREIGILRAIGWKKSRVVRMVLYEAIALSVAGAAVGTVGAVAAARGLSRLPAVSGYVDGRIPPAVIWQGLAVGLAVGLAGGLYPAFRASRLLPTEAIRHE